MSERDFGCQPGTIMVLHTWGQRMLTHIHIHAIMTAGGISVPPKKAKIPKRCNRKAQTSESEDAIVVPEAAQEPHVPKWIAIDPKSKLLTSKLLATEFQKRFVRGLKLLYKKGQLDTAAHPSTAHLNSKETFGAWLDKIASKKWVTHSGRRVRHLRGAESLIKYNSHYVSGMAISDCRIRLETDGQVTFTIKDYKNNGARKTETVSGTEFVLRFLKHIVPTGVHRVRYGGIFHGKGRKARLDQCRALAIEYNNSIDGIEPSEEAVALHPINQKEKQQSEFMPEKKIKQANLPACPVCKNPAMTRVGFQDAALTQSIIRMTRQAISLYALVWTTFDSLTAYVQSNLHLEDMLSRAMLDCVDHPYHTEVTFVPAMIDDPYEVCCWQRSTPRYSTRVPET